MNANFSLPPDAQARLDMLRKQREDARKEREKEGHAGQDENEAAADQNHNEPPA